MDLSNIVGGSPNYITLNAFQGKQFGHNVISAQCTVDYVLKFIEVDKDVQRDIIETQVTNLVSYIKYGMSGNNIYFPPLVFSSRGRGEYNEDSNKFHLNTDDTMVILDGQHRISAFEQLKKRLETSKDSEIENLKYLKNFPLTLQIFTDLNIEQERQLFTDINTKSSKVSNTLLVMYKNNDLCGDLVKDIIFNHPSIAPERFEIRARSTTKKIMTASALYNVIVLLNDGIMFSKYAKCKITNRTYNQYKKRTEDFLTLLVKYAPEHALNRDKYTIMNPHVIMAIAKFIHDAEKHNPKDSMEDIFQKVIQVFDWSHKNKSLTQISIPFNPNTRKYNFTVGTRTIKQLSSYLLQLYKNVGEFKYV